MPGPGNVSKNVHNSRSFTHLGPQKVTTSKGGLDLSHAVCLGGNPAHFPSSISYVGRTFNLAPVFSLFAREGTHLKLLTDWLWLTHMCHYMCHLVYQFWNHIQPTTNYPPNPSFPFWVSTPVASLGLGRFWLRLGLPRLRLRVLPSERRRGRDVHQENPSSPDECFLEPRVLASPTSHSVSNPTQRESIDLQYLPLDDIPVLPNQIGCGCFNLNSALSAGISYAPLRIAYDYFCHSMFTAIYQDSQDSLEPKGRWKRSESNGGKFHLFGQQEFQRCCIAAVLWLGLKKRSAP